jgi:hypothetical protein
MGPKEINPLTDAAQKRFFEALDILGLPYTTFCNKYGLHQPKYSHVRSGTIHGYKDNSYKRIDLEAIIYIVRDYHISAEWILTGQGQILNYPDVKVRMEC